MIEKAEAILSKITNIGVVLSVFCMLGLAMLSIILRQFDITFLWIDPLVRHIVLLGTFFGGALATGHNQHIKIDLISRILESKQELKLKKLLDLIITFVTVLAVVVLINSSVQLVGLELEGSGHSFLNIKTGYLIAIIPAGFLLILLQLIVKVFKILKE